MTSIPANDVHAGSGKRVVTNAAFLFVTNIYRVVFNMALFFVVARVIGASELGRYTFAISYAALFSVAVHLGLNDLIIRQVAVNKSESSRYFTAALLVKVVAGIIVTAVTAVTIGISGKPTAVQELVWAAALTASFVAGIETVVVAFFYAYERMSYILIQGIIRTTLNAIAGIGAALLGWGARGILWGFLAVEVVCAIYALVFVKLKLGVWFGKVELRDVGRMLWQSVPFGLKGIFTTVYMQLHFSLLSFYVGDVSTGVYAAAAKLITFLSFVPSALTQALYPYLSRLHTSQDGTPRWAAMMATRYLALLSLPAALFLSLRADAVVALAYGGEYETSASVLVILALSLPFIFASYPYAVTLDAIRREKANTVVAAGSALLNVITNVLLIPILGPRGAAISYLLTEGAQCAARHVLMRVWLGKLGFIKQLAPVLFPVAVMAGAMFITRSLPLYVELPLLLVIFAAAALAIRAVRPQDILAALRRGQE